MGDPDVAEVGGKRRDPVAPLTEFGQIERLGVQRPPAAGLTAGQLGFVVGKALSDLEPQIAVRLDEVEHVGAGVHECLDELVVHVTQ